MPLKPVCVPCQRFFRMTKAGYYFIEAMPGPGTNNPKPGTSEPESWTPYKLWVGDKWRCHGCGAEILSGFSMDPVSEHFKKDFDKLATASQLQVNDC